MYIGMKFGGRRTGGEGEGGEDIEMREPGGEKT